MAGSIAKLVVSLGANIAGFETDMKRATRNNEKRMRDMEKQVAAAGKAMAVAFTAAAGAMTLVVKNAANTADEMQKLSLRTGIGTEALSKYSYAAEQTGTSFEGITNGVKRMQRSLSDAEVGLSTQVRAFDRLGLSVKELSALSPEEQFEKIGSAIANLESATLRSATAQEIFGRAGADLLPLFAAGAAGMQEFGDKAERFGIIIGQQFADDAAQFNDNLDDMGRLVEGAGLKFTEGLLPALLGFQEYILDGAEASDTFVESGKALGSVVTYLVRSFILLKGILQTVASALLGIVIVVSNTLKAILAPVQATLEALVSASAKATSGDFAGAWKALSGIASSSADEFNDALKNIQLGIDGVTGASVYWNEALDESAKVLANSGKHAESTANSYGKMVDQTKKAADSANKLGDAKKKLGVRLMEIENIWDDTNKILDELIKNQEDLIAETKAYEDALQSVLDQLYPVQAEGRRLGETLALLTRANQEGTLSWDQYQDAVNRAVAGFDAAVGGMTKAAQGVDLLAIAIDEGVRIIERTFADLFTSLIDGSADAWDTIESGFKSLMASIAQEAARGVTIQIKEAFSADGGGLSDLKLSGQFGQDLLASIGQIVGIGSADSIFGQFGSIAGGIAGKALGEALGWWLGSWGGPIGTAIGSILGGALGDWIGGLFDRDLAFSLGGENQRTRDDNQQITTPLGDILGLRGQGGFGSLNDPNTFGGQLAKALTEFDTQIADIFKAVGLDDQTFSDVTTALEDWVGTFGESSDAVDVLASRFSVILGEFSGDIQNFVKGAADFEEQIERFGVALSVDKLLRENPEFFAGRTAGEVLAVVQAFQSGAESMGDAFTEFLKVANAVIGITDALRQFAGSDPAAGALGGDLSLEQALKNVNSAIFDAVAGFDGSIESLQTIAELTMVAREGEIKLLQQIDAIQKGLNANLEKLRAEIVGITQPDATGEQLFNQAQNLISSIGTAMTAGDIAGIEQQFSSIIRSIAPEDQAFMQSELVALIDIFRASANARLDTLRTDAIDSAASTRDLIDTFLAGIGDPLSIIANSLGEQSLPEVMDEGLNEINATVATIGPQVANALSQGLGNVQITVVVQDPGLVTQ